MEKFENRFKDSNNGAENEKGNIGIKVRYDDYIVYLGEFGKYQKFIYLLVALTAACVAFAPMSTVFTLGTQSFRCSLSSLENDTYKSQGVWHDMLVNKSIPKITKNGELTNSDCNIYEVSSNANLYNDTLRQVSCNDWVYDTSVLQSTVISEMNLVCDEEIYQYHASMMYFGGFLCGALVMGILADIFGRKLVLCICVPILLASNLVIVWVPNLTGYFIMRFIVGVANIGCFDAAFVMGLELVGPSKRVYAGIVIELIWCIGEAYLLLMAFWLRRWRDLQLAFSVPITAIVLYCWALPESPRWLITKGRTEKAMKILKKAAKVNKVKLPDHIGFEEPKENIRMLQIVPLLKSPRLLGRLAVSCFNWLVIAMGYFGLTLNTGLLGGDVYINFLVTVIVESIGYSLCLLFMDRLGRRPVLCISMLVGGIACICTIFTTLYADKSLHWITIVLSNIGKCGVSAAFALVFVFSSEMFPTTNRSFILGLCNVAGRIGGVASIYIARLDQLVDGQFGNALPVIIFGCLMVIAGLSSFSLPETANKNLPEYINDAIALGQTNDEKEIRVGEDLSSNTRL